MDQLGAMRTFVRAVQVGSFSAVGREQNSSQATVSKKVAALEAHLGVKLLTRTSRELSLTEVGAEYYEKCVVVLSELDEAEANARSQTASPEGILRVAAPIPFARLVLAPLAKSFTEQNPEIKIELVLSDKHVDLIAEGIDIAIRAKQLEDSALVARYLFENPMLVVASPDYLETHGTPQKPEELKRHNCIVYSHFRTLNIWHFSRESKDFSVQVKGNFQSNNGDTNMEATLCGLGITELPMWMVHEHLESGKLQQILADYQADTIPFNAIYPKSRYLPLKVRSFVDFLKAHVAEKGIFL